MEPGLVGRAQELLDQLWRPASDVSGPEPAEAEAGGALLLEGRARFLESEDPGWHLDCLHIEYRNWQAKHAKGAIGVLKAQKSRLMARYSEIIISQGKASV